MQEEDPAHEDLEIKKSTRDPETRRLRDLACRRAVKAHKYYFENPQLQNSPTVRLERLDDSFICSSQVQEKCDTTLANEVSGGECDSLINSVQSISKNNISVDSQETICKLSKSFSQVNLCPELSDSFETMIRKKRDYMDARRHSAPEAIHNLHRNVAQKVEKRRATLNEEQTGSFSNVTNCIVEDNTTKNTESSLKMRVNKIGTNMWEVNNTDNGTTKTKGKKKDNGHCKSDRKSKTGKDWSNSIKHSFSSAAANDSGKLPENEELDAKGDSISEPQNNIGANQYDIPSPSSVSIDSGCGNGVNEDIDSDRKLNDASSSDDVVKSQKEEDSCIIILSDEEEETENDLKTKNEQITESARKSVSVIQYDKHVMTNENIPCDAQSFEEQQPMECEESYPDTVNDTLEIGFIENEEYVVNEELASDLVHEDTDISDDEGRADEDRLYIDEDIPCTANDEDDDDDDDDDVASAEVNSVEKTVDQTDAVSRDISESLNEEVENTVSYEETQSSVLSSNNNVNIMHTTNNDNVTIPIKRSYAPIVEDISPANSPKDQSVIRNCETKHSSAKELIKQVHLNWKPNLEPHSVIKSGHSLSWSRNDTSAQDKCVDKDGLQIAETSNENYSSNVDTAIYENNASSLEANNDKDDFQISEISNNNDNEGSNTDAVVYENNTSAQDADEFQVVETSSDNVDSNVDTVIHENNEAEVPEALSTATEKKKKLKTKKSTGGEDNIHDDMINLQLPIKETEQDRIKVDLPRHNWLEQKLTGSNPQLPQENFNTVATTTSNATEVETREPYQSVIKSTRMPQTRTSMPPPTAEARPGAIIHPILEQLTKYPDLQVLSIKQSSPPRHMLPPQVEIRGPARAIARNTALVQNNTSGNKILQTMSRNASTSFDTAKSIGLSVSPQYLFPYDMKGVTINKEHDLVLSPHVLQSEQEEYGNPQNSTSISALGSPNGRYPQGGHRVPGNQQRVQCSRSPNATNATRSPSNYSSTSPRTLTSPQVAVTAFTSPHSVKSASQSSPIAVSSPTSYMPNSPTSQYISSSLQLSPTDNNRNLILPNTNHPVSLSFDYNSNHGMMEVSTVSHKRKNSDPIDLSMKKHRTEAEDYLKHYQDANVSMITKSAQNSHLDQTKSRVNIHNLASYRNQVSPPTSSFNNYTNNLDKQKRTVSYMPINRSPVNTDINLLSTSRHSGLNQNRLQGSDNIDINLLNMLRAIHTQDSIINNLQRIAQGNSPDNNDVEFISEMQQIPEKNLQTTTRRNSKSSHRRSYLSADDEYENYQQTVAQENISRNQGEQKQIVPQTLLNEALNIPGTFSDMKKQNDSRQIGQQVEVNNCLALERYRGSTRRTNREENGNNQLDVFDDLRRLALSNNLQEQFPDKNQFSPPYTTQERNIYSHLQPMCTFNVDAAVMAAWAAIAAVEDKQSLPIDKPKLTARPMVCGVYDEEPFSEREKSKTKHLKVVQNERQNRNYIHSNMTRHANTAAGNQYLHFNNSQSKKIQSSKFDISGQVRPNARQERHPHFFNGSQVNSNFVVPHYLNEPHYNHERYRNFSFPHNGQNANFDPRIFALQSFPPALLPSQEQLRNQRQALLPTPSHYYPPQVSNYSAEPLHRFVNNPMIPQQQQHQQDPRRWRPDQGEHYMRYPKCRYPVHENSVNIVKHTKEKEHGSKYTNKNGEHCMPEISPVGSNSPESICTKDLKSEVTNVNTVISSGTYLDDIVKSTNVNDTTVNKLVRNYTCGYCNKVAEFTCSACHREWYCSEKCQKQHWTNHNRRCKIT